MRKNKKHIIHTLVYLAIIVAVTVGGIQTGLFDSAGSMFTALHISPEAIVKVIIMSMMVLVIENIIVMILNMLPSRHARSKTMVTILSSTLRYAAAIVIVCWGLTLVGVDVATIVASVGIIALIIGFGAESLIEDVITGFFMLFENQYNVGDIVEVDGFRGTVTDIGIRITAITDPGGNVKIINNSNMKDILNRSNHASRSISEIGIPYSTDIEAFEQKIPKMMEEIYSKHTDKMKSAPVYLGVSELADSAVVLKFYVEVDEQDIYTVQRLLNRELLVSFRKAGVEVPFNQLDVHHIRMEAPKIEEENKEENTSEPSETEESKESTASSVDIGDCNEECACDECADDKEQ